MNTPERIAALRQTLPELAQVDCGEARIAWLDGSASVEDAVVDLTLHPEEYKAAAAMRAVARREEYRRARYLVRALTGSRDPLTRDPSGMPAWPPGVIGSITHKDGAVGVALAPAAALASLGIDAEDVARVRPEFEPRILRAPESALVDALVARRPEPRTHWIALIFSFKEALFKCHYPLGRTMFWFHDAEVEALDPDAGRIAARVLKDTSPLTPAGHRTEGAFVSRPSDAKALVVTSAWEPVAGLAPSSPPPSN